MANFEIQNEPYAVDNDRERQLPPTGSALPPIKIRGTQNDAFAKHPLHWRLEDAAKRWKELIKRYCANFQIFVEVDNKVHCVLTESDVDSPAENVGAFDRLNDEIAPYFRRQTPEDRAAWAWHFFRLHAQLGLNQYARGVSWTIPDARFRPDEISRTFDLALEWQLDARSPSRQNRMLTPENFLRMEGSKALGQLISELLNGGSPKNREAVADALNEVLFRDDLYTVTNFFRQHSETLPHLQVTRRLVNIIRSLIAEASMIGVSDTKEWELRIRRLWIEGLLHNPEPATYEMSRFFPDVIENREGFMEVWSPVEKLPIAPYFDGATGDTWCPLYLEPSSRLLGMIRLIDFSPTQNDSELKHLGAAVQQLIVPMIRATRCAFEPIYRMKACQSEGQILEVVNYLANEFIGANDSCIRFQYTGGDKAECDDAVGVSSYLRCAHANCQYQHKDFEPGLGVEEGIGTVWDILHPSEGDERDAEIISSLFTDQRHRNACESFIAEQVTFYDQSAIQVLLEHKGEKGVAVLQRLSQAAFSPGEVSLFQSILKVAEMRLDELEAEAEREQDVVDGESPLDAMGYRQIFNRLSKRRGGLAKIVNELIARHCAPFGTDIEHELHTIALVSLERTAISEQSLEVHTRFCEGDTTSLLQSPSFCEQILREISNHDILRSFWTWKLPTGTTQLWRDVFHNSRIAELHATLEEALDPHLVLWAPLAVRNNLFLWVEYTLAQECTAETVLGLNHWWGLERAVADLNRIIQAERRRTITENATRGQIAAPLRHNIQQLFNDLDFELTELADSARSCGLNEQLNELGLSKVRQAISVVKNAALNFGSLVRLPILKKCDSESLFAYIERQIRKQVRRIGGRVTIAEAVPGITLDIDKQQLSVAVTELVNNSRREFERCNSSPRIWIWTEVRDREFHLHFEDNGRGVSADAADRIFEWHFRGPESDGTGLGLFMVRSILANIDAMISLQPPRFESGAHFRISIPVRESNVD